MTPGILISGNLQDICGNANQGQLRVQLCNYGAIFPSISNGPVLAGALVDQVIEVAEDGSFSFALWGNDVIVPLQTYYVITVLDDEGNVAQCAAYFFAGTGAFNLASVSPIAPPSQIVPSTLTPIYVNPPDGETQEIMAGGLIIGGSLTVNGAVDVTGAIAYGGYQQFLNAQGNLTVYVSSGCIIAPTLVGNLTLFLNGLTPGQEVTLMIGQDATGGHTITYPSNMINFNQPSPTPNSLSIQTGRVGADGNLYVSSGMTVN